jgi:ribosomal protein L12E/L44/L45/RPP1/RPP2
VYRPRPAGSRFAQRCRRAHDVLLHHHVGRASDDEEMLHIVAANKDEAPPAIDRCLVDHGEPRLASARGGAAEPAAAESAQQPERQRQQDEHHDDEENDLEAALSFTE